MLRDADRWTLHQAAITRTLLISCATIMRFVIYFVELHVTLGGKQQGASRSPFWIKVVGVSVCEYYEQYRATCQQAVGLIVGFWERTTANTSKFVYFTVSVFASVVIDGLIVCM